MAASSAASALSVIDAGMQPQRSRPQMTFLWLIYHRGHAGRIDTGRFWRLPESYRTGLPLGCHGRGCTRGSQEPWGSIRLAGPGASIFFRNGGAPPPRHRRGNPSWTERGVAGGQPLASTQSRIDPGGAEPASAPVGLLAAASLAACGAASRDVASRIAPRPCRLRVGRFPTAYSVSEQDVIGICGPYTGAAGAARYWRCGFASRGSATQYVHLPPLVRWCPPAIR